jgi:hypothetical protein
VIVRKLLVTDGSSEREIVLVGTLVVGRDPSCHLNALDPLLSRRHAEFVSTGQGVTIRDLKSRNGILVNGNKVPQHALKPGDVIQLGHLHMQYVEESVVKSLEDSSRYHATTATGFDLPTMAPVPRPADAGRPSAAATAPTATAPGPREPGASQTAPVKARPDADDPDATRAPVAHAPAAVQDADATIAPPSRPQSAPRSAPSDDETRAPVVRPHPAATVTTPALQTEARLVANVNLIVTEASSGCPAVIGARPETLVGGQLADAISRSVRFVATGDGPSSLSLSIARASSGKTVTVTFRAGQATGNL